jgi:hypothetical protein
MAVFWVVAPCIMVEVYRFFRGICCLHHQDDSYIWLRERMVKEELNVCLHPPEERVVQELYE